ncbi:hypothetical protein ACRAJ3_11485 [Rhodococcus pyridinivorans]|uniref:hypothetical protein n=1 Tax=Rhodococcus pyridinivorans TaxID=103816 RepID=UPI003D7F4674
MSRQDEIRQFDDIPDGAVFADKFGRVYTKSGPGRATDHEKFDDSREYYEMTQDEYEDDPFVFDTWPYYLLAT